MTPGNPANPSPSAQDRGQPCLPGSQLPTSLGAAATCTEGSGDWGHRAGTICPLSSPLSCSEARSGVSGSFSLSLCDCPLLSLSLLSCPGQLSDGTAALPSPPLPTPGPSPRRRSPGPSRSGSLGAAAAAWGAGCAAGLWTRGGKGPGSLPAAAALPPSLSGLLHWQRHLGRKPRSAPDLVLDLLRLDPCLPSSKPVSSP